MKLEEMYTPQEIKEAKKRVKARKEFYQHLMAFVIVNTFLFLSNLLTSPFHWWFLYPFLGWGIGLAFHYVEVFGIPGFNILTKEWEQEQLQKELTQMHYERHNQRKQLREPEQLGEEELELPALQKKYDDSEFV
ncbi:MAG: hypothetical protein KatS3mg029_0719 [Saprospiraceae bacterium]|nr:MAG: hypothetical protein KatS3mg029_0719 [Saprospiraceae bacterium]